MRELHFLAWIKLKAIEEDENGNHGVIALRKRIIERLSTEPNYAGTRDLIRFLIEELENDKV